MVIILANVRGQVSPLAFGADPASAGCVTKVPKAWGLTAPPRSAYFCSLRNTLAATLLSGSILSIA